MCWPCGINLQQGILKAHLTGFDRIKRGVGPCGLKPQWSLSIDVIAEIKELSHGFSLMKLKLI